MTIHIKRTHFPVDSIPIDKNVARLMDYEPVDRNLIPFFHCYSLICLSHVFNLRSANVGNLISTPRHSLTFDIDSSTLAH